MIRIAAALLLSVFSVALVAEEVVVGVPMESRDLSGWGRRISQWGDNNLSVLEQESGRSWEPSHYLRVGLPKGAIDPATMKRRGLPRGGAGFKAPLVSGGANKATLIYKMRLPAGFPFVRGGKLPGLYGGQGNSGGRVPDGFDGFSFRLMWRENGALEIYGYLPGIEKYGRSFFRGRARLVPGYWHKIEEELVLNDPGKANGALMLKVDGRLVGVASNLMVRRQEDLRIDGIFFDVFFGGNDDSWAPPIDTYIDFADFSLAYGR